MVGAEGQMDLHIHHGIARQHTGLHGALDALIHRRDILLGDHAAGDLVEELIALAGLVGLHGDTHMAVLALTAGLPGILGVLLDGFLDGLLIGDLGRAHVGLHLVFTEQTVHDNLQMELTHTGDDGLSGLLVGPGLEGGVLLGQLHQRQAHLLLTSLGLGLDGHTDDRLGELHGLEDDGVLLIAQGITGGGVLQTDDRGDIAGIDGLDILPVVGVHLQDAADTLLLVLCAVEHRSTGVEHTGVHADKGQPAHIGIRGNLECQRGEGGVVVRRAGVLLLGVRVDAVDGGNVNRRGHEVHDGVQQLLHTLIFVRGAAGHRDNLVVDGALPEHLADQILGDGLLLQRQLHDLVGEVGAGVDEFGAVFLRQLHHIGRDLLHAHVLAHLVIIDVGVHLHQVNDTLEGLLLADGELNGHGIAFQAVVDHTQHVVEIGAHDVHFVDIDHAGDLVVVGLAPHGLRLGLDAALGAHDGHRAVQHAQGALHLHGEVHVTRGVDDIDTGLGELVLAALPIAGGGSGGDGDAAFLLLGHPVHGGGTVVGLADLIVDAGVEQNPFCRGGLAGVDMSHDTDVPGIL